MERWRVILRFVEQHRRPIIYAGSDVRFLRPAKHLHMALADLELDAAFEGQIEERAITFTPDLILAYPTPKMMAFVSMILDGLQAAMHSVPIELQQRPELVQHLPPARRTQAHLLLGPAQQDFLHDTLLSVLLNVSRTTRRDLLLHELLTRPRNASSVVRHNLLVTPRDHDERLRTLSLSTSRLPHGALISTARLRALLGSQRFMRTDELPCKRCDNYRAPLRRRAGELHEPSWSAVYALHCIGKQPDCLDVCRCSCALPLFCVSSQAESHPERGANYTLELELQRTSNDGGIRMRSS